MIRNNTNLTKNDNLILLHLADKKLNRSHFEYWNDILIQSQENFCVLVRDKESFDEIVVAYPHHQIFLAQTPVEVEEIVMSQEALKGVFYPVNSIKNIHLLRFNHLKHIFIGTKYSDQLIHINKSHRAYDEIWLSGKYMLKRYDEELENQGHLLFKEVGKPQVKSCFINQREPLTDYETLFIHISKKDESLLNYLGVLLLGLRGKKIYLLIENTEQQIQLEDFLATQRLDIEFSFEKEDCKKFAQNADRIVCDIKTISVYHLMFAKPLMLYVDKELALDYEQKIIIPRECYFPFSSLEEFNEISFEMKSYQKSLLENAEYFLGRDATLSDNFLKSCQELSV